MPCHYGASLDCNDPVLLYCLYQFIFCKLCGVDVACVEYCSHMGGSDDMKSLVIIGGVSVRYVGIHIVFGCVH